VAPALTIMGISSRYHAFCCLFQIDQKLFTFPGSLPKWVSVTQRLTQAFVHGHAANGRDRIVFDSQVPGLGLRITPTGTRIYIAQGRVAGRKRRITVGFADRMPLSEARTEALQLLAVMRRGVDPTEDRKARLRAAQAESITIRELSEQWMAEYVIPKLKPRTRGDYQQLLTRHILPALGNLAVAEIDRRHIEQRHVAMAGTPRRANYAVAVIKAMLSFAIKRDLRSNNPAVGITPYRENRRERFLSEAEIGAAADGITAAEKSGKIGPFAAAGLRLALFTGARSGEVTAFQWSQIDWERRLIRLPDSKTNEPKTVHLSDAAIEVLKGIPRIGPYVVAGGRRNQPYAHLTRAWGVARKHAGLDAVRLHDLRHSYASLALGRGVPLAVIGKLLGHKNPATTQRYAHLARDAVQAVNDEIGAAMQAAIMKPRSKVVKLRS
jgi:integrase